MSEHSKIIELCFTIFEFFYMFILIIMKRESLILFILRYVFEETCYYKKKRIKRIK